MNSILTNVLRATRDNAYVPDSHFSLSALVISNENFITAGVNWESSDRSVGACGETAAILNMVSCNGPSVLKQILMMGGNKGEDDKDKSYSSCSACRQFMLEMDENGNADVETTSINGKVSEAQSIQSMMPNPFVFSNYIQDPIKGCLGSDKIVPAPRTLRGVDIVEDEDEVWFHQELLNAANRSFSPDESYFQGAILVAENGAAYCGSLFQTANFKSSRDAITAALSMLISFDGVQRIKDVHFLHVENRPFAKNHNIQLPLNMLTVLRNFGAQNIFVHSDKGIDRVLNIANSLKPFEQNDSRVDVSPLKTPFEVPLEYRGLWPLIV